MSEIVFQDESYQIMGACFEVYNQMGTGFLEPVYQECLSFEFQHRAIPAVGKHRLLLKYKQHQLDSTYQPDFVCYEKIIVELKSIKVLTDIERAQVHNYLKATNYKLGLLVNFGQYPKVVYERIVR